MQEMLSKMRLGTIIFIHDLIMVALAWLGAYWLRFNLSLPPELETQTSLRWLPLVLVVQGVFFHRLGLYRGIWRFASVPDLVRIAKSSCLGIATIAIVLFSVNRLHGVPRSVIPLYAVLLLFLLSTPRLIYRVWKDRGAPLSAGRRALIVGAGKAGEMLVRDLLRASGAKFAPVALVDDDPKKKGSEIHGVRVRGRCEQIPRLVEKLAIETILIAVPSATDKEMRRIVEICEGAGVPFLTLPSMQEMLSGQMSGHLREVSIEDLLGREPIKLDRKGIQAHLGGKRVLVTGGGGSIGSELCKQIAQFSVAELIVFERCEFNLYQVERALRRSFPGLRLSAILGDVTDEPDVRRVISQYRPEIIFHAAAYKHVPLLEYQVRQAVVNNVLGTFTVAEAAVAAGVDEFVLISTDKAVSPENVMGATKRAAEVLVQSMNGVAGTRFINVRFGNVLDSAGSVVPLFREQIKAGGPITVTHPDITRYFMTIPEACQLIMQAATVGKGGEVFVLDMGDPVKISYLAEQMIRLSGKRPGQDIKIEYIGLRPGEKLREELFNDHERPTPTEHSKLLLAHPRNVDHRMVRKAVNELAEACRSFDEAAILHKLKLLVPEYVQRSADEYGTKDRSAVQRLLVL
ncbi:polysaccharide biosynthesis protein [Methylocaldum szegediense]|uniref:Capsular polysaccharide biosynthesis protein CapD n=1 Tax=Methylocaldum szegediense TaxID=73780 RepID=A0ABM9I5A7_9GAMM|nr:nucleoside-diphosphate sugar epimerase/dehydratase [Methylocaldum szegediense]CAI8902169.1 Capsular polysaccharide biosynthesis protein CapD [Methylocaldum szegediense]